jgi:hypothetical protein
MNIPNLPPSKQQLSVSPTLRLVSAPLRHSQERGSIPKTQTEFYDRVKLNLLTAINTKAPIALIEFALDQQDSVIAAWESIIERDRWLFPWVRSAMINSLPEYPDQRFLVIQFCFGGDR